MRVFCFASGLILLALPAYAAEACNAAFAKMDENSRQAVAAMDAVKAGIPAIPDNLDTMSDADVEAFARRYCAAWRQAPIAALVQAAEQGLADAQHGESICTGQDKTFAQSEVKYSEERKASVASMIASFEEQCRGL